MLKKTLLTAVAALTISAAATPISIPDANAAYCTSTTCSSTMSSSSSSWGITTTTFGGCGFYYGRC